MKTLVTDEYNLKNLECQYFEICKYFNAKQCLYGSPCKYSIDTKLENKEIKKTIRSQLKIMLEDYVTEDNLHYQIFLK